MRKFIFIFSIIFSNLSFSGESIEIFLDDQHKNLFGYIEKNIELIDKDKNLLKLPQMELVLLILKTVKEKNPANKFRNTPFDYAKEHRHEEIVKLFEN